MENYRIRKIDAHTWQLEDPFRTYLYLIEGTERAVLLDAGNGFSGLQETIASPYRQAGKRGFDTWSL